MLAMKPGGRCGVKRRGRTRGQRLCVGAELGDPRRSPPPVESVIVRQRVDDLDAAVPFYEKLTGSTTSRFGFAGVTLASVGPFLLFSGPDEAVQGVTGVTATLTVADVEAAVREVVAGGAEVAARASRRRTVTGPCCAIRTGGRLRVRRPVESTSGLRSTASAEGLELRGSRAADVVTFFAVHSSVRGTHRGSPAAEGPAHPPQGKRTSGAGRACDGTARCATVGEAASYRISPSRPR